MPFVQQPDARQVYPAYERARRREVERILKAIPHHDLAIQWDVCLEMLAWDGRWPTSPAFSRNGSDLRRKLRETGRSCAEWCRARLSSVLRGSRRQALR